MKSIEQIKDEYAKEISYMDWFTMTMRQMRITNNQVNEVARRYAQQYKDLNDEMLEMLERVKKWWHSEDIMNDHLPIEEIEQLIAKAKEL